MRLKDKTALITGAAGGIGSAVVKRFAEEGARVILSDLHEDGCQKLLKEMEGCAGGIITADVTKEDDVVALFSAIKENYGRLDIVANIAGGDFENQAAVDEIS
jgi:NAD(P)-dependent dehydrogenase (short-subunit alcohol dehydrogenase family)